jgi:nickel/cobalt transporter (NiCoT) family protein
VKRPQVRLGELMAGLTTAERRLLSGELHIRGGLWDFMASFDINKAGFAIAAMFVAVWAAAVAFWKFGKLDRRWAPAAARPGGPEPPEES